MPFTSGECFPFEKCENFRELGGYATTDGKHVKRGMFYRSPALCHIKTAHDIALFDSFGIKHIFDFRSKLEREATPDPVFIGAEYHPIAATLTNTSQEINFDLPSILKSGELGVNQLLQSVSDGYKILPFANPAYVELFRQIKAKDTPVLFHCTAGKDRTGVAAALILLMLGASEDTVYHDYMLTNENRKAGIAALLKGYGHLFDNAKDAEKFINMIAGVDDMNLRSTLDEIKSVYDTYQRYFEEEFGIDKVTLSDLKDFYLE